MFVSDKSLDGAFLLFAVYFFFATALAIWKLVDIAFWIYRNVSISISG